MSVNSKQKQNKIDKTLNVELNDALFKFIDANDVGKHQTTLVGKPRNLIIDIIKRFCKNYIALASLILIIIISLLCVIFPLTSPFSATDPISTVNNIWLTQLPPSYSPIVTESLDLQKWETLKTVVEQNPNANILIEGPIEINNNYLVTYNKYLFISIMLIIINCYY